MGMREITNLNDCLRYSLLPLERVWYKGPRFQELLNATKSPRIVNCKLFFKEGNSTVQELRNTINHNIVCLTLKDISENISVEIDKEPEWWYDVFDILYNNDYREFAHCISVKLNPKLLFKYRLTLDDIATKLEDEYDEIKCVFSPPSLYRLDIFIDVSNIKLSEKQLLFITNDNREEIFLDECARPALENMVICGIPGITSMYFTLDKNEWYVETDGCNYKKLLGLDLIDATRLQCNNVWDIYDNLGIEAARQFLIDEFMEIMEGINVCHVKLLVDKMTYSGGISSITRYTLRKDESGPISRSSFEESVDIFIKAGFNCEVERTRGVSASIVCGKRTNAGTGFMDLKMDLSKLPKSKPVMETIKEE